MIVVSTIIRYIINTIQKSMKKNMVLLQYAFD